MLLLSYENNNVRIAYTAAPSLISICKNPSMSLFGHGRGLRGLSGVSTGGGVVYGGRPSHNRA